MVVKRKEEQKAKVTPKKAKLQKKDSESEESEEEVEVKGKKVVAKEAPKKKAPPKKEESDSEEMSEEENGKAAKGKAAAKKTPQKKKEESSGSEEESEEEGKGKKAAKKAEPPKKVETPKKVEPKKGAKKADPPKKKKEDSDEDEEEEEEEKEEKKDNKKGNKKEVTTKGNKEKDEDEEEGDEEEEKEKDEEKEKEEEEEDTGFVKKSAANAAPLAFKGQNGGRSSFGGASAAPTSQPNSRVFVGNLSFKIDDETITQFFADCGKITDIKWMMDRETGRFRGAGHLEFDSIEAATKAVAKAGQDLMERPIKVDFALPSRSRDGGAGGKGGRGGKSYVPREKPAGTHTIFTGGWPDSATDDDVYELFGKCGDIQKIRWVSDKETGKFKGLGFIVFGESDATDKAVALNGLAFQGRTLRIDFADD